ncbi:MAG: hypothetical protein K2O18_03090 [Oscillospiraceae bacterium]|nr:hypothetical protein [Oscillospiraceae bacterium]
MMRFISAERMVKSGFTLTTCSDGKFWVLEKNAGEEADRIAALCKKVLREMDSTSVKDIIVLQCDQGFRSPALYMDGIFLDMTQREFIQITDHLIRGK